MLGGVGPAHREAEDREDVGREVELASDLPAPYAQGIYATPAGTTR